MKIQKYLLAFSLVALIGLLAASCTGATATTTPTTPTTSTAPTPTAAPTLTITAPGTGNKFGIGSVQVTVQTANFTLVNKIGQAPTPGEGHIIYYMDVALPTTAGSPAVTTPGTFVTSTDTSYTWTNVNSGTHTFAVQLVNNDNTPLNPPVTASASLLVIPEIGPPLAVIVSPRTGAIVQGSSVTVTAQATNFNIVDKIGQANAAREGHFIFYMDVEPPTVQGNPATTSGSTYAATANDSYTWQNVTPGAHTFAIQLVNNDNTPLSPTVVASIAVTIAAQ